MREGAVGGGAGLVWLQGDPTLVVATWAHCRAGRDTESRLSSPHTTLTATSAAVAQSPNYGDDLCFVENPSPPKLL